MTQKSNNKNDDGKLGRHKLEYVHAIPKFLQGAISRLDAKEKAKFDPTPPVEDSSSEKEDELPVVEAEDYLKRQLAQQQERIKQIEKQQRAERRENEDRRMLKTIINQSKFAVDEKNALVYHRSEERVTKESDTRNKKRKLNREKKIDELKKKKQHIETEEETETTTTESPTKEQQQTKQTNTKLLTFSFDEEERGI
jgi:hypothetical protein